MSKARRRLLKAWHRVSSWVAAAATLALLAVTIFWSSRALFVPYVIMAISALLIAAIWFVVLWPKVEIAALSWTAAIGSGVVSFGLTTGLAIFLVERARDRHLESSGMNAMRSEFAAGKDFKDGARTSPPGKVAVLERAEFGKWDYTALQFDVSRHQIPDAAAEVDTVILVSWKEEIIGKFLIGQVAREWKADVLCIDWRTKAVTQRAQIVSERKRDAQGEHMQIGRPDAEVREWMRKALQ